MAVHDKYLIPLGDEYVSILDAIEARDQILEYHQKLPLKQRKRYIKIYSKVERQVLEKNVYVIHKYKLKSVEDLVDFLSSQYLRINELSMELIADPLFFVWLKRNTINFPFALELMSSWLRESNPTPLAEI